MVHGQYPASVFVKSNSVVMRHVLLLCDMCYPSARFNSIPCYSPGTRGSTEELGSASVPSAQPLLSQRVQVCNIHAIDTATHTATNKRIRSPPVPLNRISYIPESASYTTFLALSTESHTPDNRGRHPVSMCHGAVSTSNSSHYISKTM